MIDFAKQLGNDPEMIRLAQLFVQQPRNSVSTVLAIPWNLWSETMKFVLFSADKIAGSILSDCTKERGARWVIPLSIRWIGFQSI